jgi:hypothetical protein
MRAGDEPETPTAATFPLGGARNGALSAGLALAMAVETVALHFMLMPRHAAIAWTLVALNVATAAWLAADHRAMGRAAVRVGDDEIELAVGLRVAATFRREQVTNVLLATWRDVPPGTERDYLNATGPAEPNVILTLAPPATVRLAGVIPRTASRIGLRVDDAPAFVAALGAEGRLSGQPRGQLP